MTMQTWSSLVPTHEIVHEEILLDVKDEGEI